MQKESASQPARSDFKNHAANKMAFKEYMELFPEGREAIRIKSTTQPSATTQPFKDQMTTGYQRSSTSSLRSLLVGKLRPSQNLHSTIRKLMSPRKVQPTLPASEPDDGELLMAAEQLESQESDVPRPMELQVSSYYI